MLLGDISKMRKDIFMTDFFMWQSFILERKIKMPLYVHGHWTIQAEKILGWKLKHYQDNFRVSFSFWILMMITISSFKGPILLICPYEIYPRRVFLRFAVGEIWCCFLLACFLVFFSQKICLTAVQGLFFTYIVFET